MQREAKKEVLSNAGGMGWQGWDGSSALSKGGGFSILGIVAIIKCGSRVSIATKFFFEKLENCTLGEIS